MFIFEKVIIVSLVLMVSARPDHVRVVQDTIGNYMVQYDLDDVKRNEHRNQDGSYTGSYSYALTPGPVAQLPQTPQILNTLYTETGTPIILPRTVPYTSVPTVGNVKYIPIVQYVRRY